MNVPRRASLWSVGWIVAFGATIGVSLDEGPRIADPYAGGAGKWYRGQVHAHSTTHKSFVSVDSLRDKVERYRDAGYDFVCMSDHNQVTKVLEAPNFPLPTRDPGVPGIHFISGAEIGFNVLPNTDSPPRKHHFGAVGMDWSVAKGESLFWLEETHFSTAQAAIDSIRSREYARGKSALAILNHPEMEAMADVRLYPSDLRALSGQAGIEVYNTKWAKSKPRSKTWQSHGASAWDYLLATGSGTRWGFATDDAHEYVFGEDFLGGWISVQAETLTTESILDAVLAGRFFACVDSCAGAVRDTASAVFTEIGARGDRIVAASDRPSEFTWWTDGGHLVRTTKAALADTFHVEGWERVVRVRLRNDRGAAYAQPFFVENPSRDEDRWRLRPEKGTLRLYHFDEGAGPTLADAMRPEHPLRILRGVIPSVEGWMSLADTIAWRDSLWGGWLHNGFGTTPDEVDVDRDRSGYAFRAHGRDWYAVGGAGAGRGRDGDLRSLAEGTIEVVGVLHSRGEEAQPLLVCERLSSDGAVFGWRLEATPETDAEEFRFRFSSGSAAREIAFGRGLAGDAQIIAVTFSTTKKGGTLRAFAGGEAAGQVEWNGAGVTPEKRAPNSQEEEIFLFRDPFTIESSPPVDFAMRELRVTQGVRSDDAIRDDAARLLLTNPASPPRPR